MNLKNAKLGMVIVDLQNDFLAPDGAYARGNTLSAEAVQLPERMAPPVQSGPGNRSSSKPTGGMPTTTSRPWHRHFWSKPQAANISCTSQKEFCVSRIT